MKVPDGAHLTAAIEDWSSEETGAAPRPASFFSRYPVPVVPSQCGLEMCAFHGYQNTGLSVSRDMSIDKTVISVYGATGIKGEQSDSP